MGFNADGSRVQITTAKTIGFKGVDREADLHEDILEECRKNEWPVVHSRMDRPQTAAVGTPDFVIAMPGGETLWVEAKSAKGKLTMEQLAWMAALRKVGHRSGVVRSIEEFRALCSCFEEP